MVPLTLYLEVVPHLSLQSAQMAQMHDVRCIALNFP